MSSGIVVRRASTWARDGLLSFCYSLQPASGRRRGSDSEQTTNHRVRSCCAESIAAVGNHGNLKFGRPIHGCSGC